MWSLGTGRTLELVIIFRTTRKLRLEIPLDRKNEKAVTYRFCPRFFWGGLGQWVHHLPPIHIDGYTLRLLFDGVH